MTEKRFKVFSFDIEELNDELTEKDAETKRYPDNNCPQCGWETTLLYAAEETEDAAHELIRQGKAGLCGDCFSSRLTELEVVVIIPLETPK
ncbi:MAG: hypothetical protein PHI29_13235 [Gallionella sp.]|nr:hypothetical protein [Gallionella sp.]